MATAPIGSGAEPRTLPAPRPLVAWRTWWPVFFVVAASTAAASVINTYSALICSRPENSCTVTRGSLAFSYTEDLSVGELVKATVEGAYSPMPDRMHDGMGERVYLHTRSESFRLLDNDEWRHAKRESEAARINAFINDPTISHLEVSFDRRTRLLLWAFGASGLFGVLWVGARVLRRR